MALQSTFDGIDHSNVGAKTRHPQLYLVRVDLTAQTDAVGKVLLAIKS